MTSIVNRIIKDIISEDISFTRLMIGNKKRKRLTFNLLHTQPLELERNYDIRKFVVLRIFINSWNGLAIFNRKMSKKEKLLKELHDVNYRFYNDVMDGLVHEDAIGMDKDHLFRALRYVPNKVIKEWIKEIKEQLTK